MKTKYIDINSETLSYFDSEKGNTTLLFIHGAFINKEYWNNQLTHFSLDFRVIAVDLASHGSSTQNRNEWTIQSYGKDIGDFIEKLSLKNVILIGHSMGSDVMLETVAHHPSEIKGLIEVDHMKNVGVTLPQVDIDQLVASLKTDFANTCEQYAKQALVTEATDPELVTRLLKDYSEMDPSVGVPLLQNSLSYPSREAELLQSLALKPFLLHVNYVPTNKDNLEKYLGKNFKLKTMNGTCHYPMIENPNEFNTSLAGIVSEINGG